MSVKSNNYVEEVTEVAISRKISLVCISKPRFKLLSLLVTAARMRRLLNRLAGMNIDLIILS